MTDNVEWREWRILPGITPLSRPGGYLIRNIVNGKPYIGISGVKTGIAGRIDGHKRGDSGRKFRNAVRKYGPGAFLVTPLFYVVGEVDKEWLQEVEADLIRDYDSVANGYNTVAAAGGVGPYGPEFGKIISATRKGISPCAAARENIRKAKLGKKQLPETVAKRNASNTGKKRSDVTRARLRESRRGQLLWRRPDGTQYHARSPIGPNDVRGFHSDELIEASRSVRLGLKVWRTPDGVRYRALFPRSSEDLPGWGRGLFHSDQTKLYLSKIQEGFRWWVTEDGITYKAVLPRNPADINGRKRSDATR